MKEYNKPLFEIIKFEKEKVIVTSGCGYATGGGSYNWTCTIYTNRGNTPQQDCEAFSCSGTYTD